MLKKSKSLKSALRILKVVAKVIGFFLYGSYIYFLSGFVIILILSAISNPLNIITQTFETFKLMHEITFSKFPLYAYFIFGGFICEAVIRLSVIFPSWNIEDKKDFIPYKRWLTLSGLLFAQLVSLYVFWNI